MGICTLIGVCSIDLKGEVCLDNLDECVFEFYVWSFTNQHDVASDPLMLLTCFGPLLGPHGIWKCTSNTDAAPDWHLGSLLLDTYSRPLASELPVLQASPKVPDIRLEIGALTCGQTGEHLSMPWPLARSIHHGAWLPGVSLAAMIGPTYLKRVMPPPRSMVLDQLPQPQEAAPSCATCVNALVHLPGPPIRLRP